MIGHREMNAADYLGILKRRVWWFVIPLAIFPVLALGISMVLPKTFTSQTLVLVEDPSVPTSVIAPIVNDMLNQRLGTMREQILSRTRLQPILERFGLFQNESLPGTTEELVVRLRRAVTVTPVQPIVRAQQNQDLQGFTISVALYDARIAQQVCAEITAMFMEENLQSREQKAVSTTEFLQRQLVEAQTKLNEEDRKLAEFKQRYVGQLPGQEQINMNLLMGATTQLEAATQALNRAQQDKAYLQSVLAQSLTTWEASKAGTNPVPLEQQLDALNNRLVTLEGQYTQNHPDVIKARADVTQLEKKIEEAKTSNAAKPATTEQSTTMEPPNIQQLRAQVYNLETTMKEKIQMQQHAQGQIKIYQARVQLSPIVEQQFKDLTRDYQTALESYNELLKKRTNSQIATNLERSQQGQQFRMMDPANLPGKPSFPDPLLFAGGGLGAGLGVGLGLMLLLEFRDKSIRTESDVEALLGIPALVLMPVIGATSTNAKKSKGWKFGKRAAERGVPA